MILSCLSIIFFVNFPEAFILFTLLCFNPAFFFRMGIFFYKCVRAEL
jgi:hypothetical protein